MHKEFITKDAPNGKVRVLFFITGLCDLLHVISIVLESNLNYFLYHSITVALYTVEMSFIWNVRKIFYSKVLKVLFVLSLIYCVCWIVISLVLMMLEILGY